MAGLKRTASGNLKGQVFCCIVFFAILLFASFKALESLGTKRNLLLLSEGPENGAGHPMAVSSRLQDWLGMAEAMTLHDWLDPAEARADGGGGANESHLPAGLRPRIFVYKLPPDLLPDCCDAPFGLDLTR